MKNMTQFDAEVFSTL